MQAACGVHQSTTLSAGCRGNGGNALLEPSQVGLVDFSHPLWAAAFGLLTFHLQYRIPDLGEETVQAILTSPALSVVWLVWQPRASPAKPHPGGVVQGASTVSCDSLSSFPSLCRATGTL